MLRYIKDKMKHNYINYKKINKDLDKLLSKPLFKVEKEFIPNENDLKKINKKLFPDNEHEFFAWKYRSLPVKANNVEFVLAYQIEDVMKKSFLGKRESFWEILWWCIETISIIHPFLDWNRRTVWEYTNIWLEWKWYKKIDWVKLRPIWEKNKYLENTDFLNICLENIL